MNDDDPRHGTRAGYRAHRRAATTACDACKRAAAASQARLEGNWSRGIRGRADTIGVQRRLQALSAIGYTWTALDVHLGVAMTEKLVSGRLHYVFAETHAKVAALYENLRDTPPPETTPAERGAVTKAKRRAARNGWATPDRWLNIDDPDEQPDPGYDGRRRSPEDLDPVVIDRILAGDFTLAATATRRERIEVVARWRAAGHPTNELERRTGWEPRRYTPDEGAAA